MSMQHMATAVLDAFRDRMVDLYNEPDLLADLRRARIVEKGYGFRLDMMARGDAQGSGTRHGDAATAFALSLLMAKRFSSGCGTVDISTRQLVLWPMAAA
jgi:hypothetical protein